MIYLFGKRRINVSFIRQTSNKSDVRYRYLQLYLLTLSDVNHHLRGNKPPSIPFARYEKSLCVDDKTFIGRGNGGYRFIQSRQDNIQLGLRPRRILLVSTE